MPLTLRAGLLAAALAMLPGVSAAQAPPPADVPPLHRPLDALLDLNVRDGLVYYRALKGERGRLDRYIDSLDVSPSVYASWSRDEKLAYWLNAYNAIVLQTVVQHYPIRGRSAEYPESSIRQIPGAFERKAHRLAGRVLSLDDIEKTILPEFKDPRAYLALGRGAIGSGRLRSEAFTAAGLERQLQAVRAEFVNDASMLRLDRLGGDLSVTPIVSWRAPEFIAAYDPGAEGPFAARSPIERAIIEFIRPHLLPLERALVEKNRFTVAFHPFDWRLNDLSGGRVD